MSVIGAAYVARSKERASAQRERRCRAMRHCCRHATYYDAMLAIMNMLLPPSAMAEWR